MGSLIGYARTASSPHGSTCEYINLAKQRAALVAAGCESVFEELCSGMLPLADRKGFAEVLKSLQAGDTLVVVDMARLSRSFLGLAVILSDLQKHDVKLRILHPPAEFHNLDQALDQASRDFVAERHIDHWAKRRPALGC
jgi:DNA invertase Pin-like site-specific DNA recombinase